MADDNTITVTFDKPLKKSEITTDDLAITIDTIFIVKFTWTATIENPSAMQLYLNIESVLEGGEKITIRFVNYKKFRAEEGG